MLSEFFRYEEFKVYYIVSLSILAFAVLRKIIQGPRYTKTNRVDGQVILITGGNTGIGKETAIELAKRGAIVHLACRSLERGNAAKHDIILQSGNRNVFVRQLDLASFESIREFARKFIIEIPKLDVLINNAAVMACPRILTKDGFESQIGVNHMGHFLLTNLLLDLLKKSSPSRIVNVSSLAHRFGKIKINDLNSEKSYSEIGGYSQSKLANVLFTRELAMRLKATGVTVNALHPGTVNTELSRDMGKMSIFLNKYFVGIGKWLFTKTPNAGAQTSTMVAIDPDLKEVTGKYFSDCKEGTIGKLGLDEEMGKNLWKISEKWTKLDIKSQ